MNMTIREKTVALIDALKTTCTTYGMGNDGNEYKIITQVFLYKFLNDKFGYALKTSKSPYAAKIREAEKWEVAYSQLTDMDRMMLLASLSPDLPRLKPEHLIANLWNQQAKGDFDFIFDNTMSDIAEQNLAIFSTQTTQNTKIPLFEPITQYVTDMAQRAPFARAMVDKLANFSFEEAFAEHYDFFANIFEYLIKDYNTAGGGKYAEYYTPHAIATIMARLLVGNNADLHNVECYDPSAGTGTLLMALAHQVGENRCTIFAQDISQRSNKMLKLNLLLNGLVSSLDHAIQGDTLVSPYHKSDDGGSLRQFDYVVSNPPFKMDFSDTREKIAAFPARFWAGVPKVPAKKKESMAIYTCFIQHVINSLKSGSGKGAIVIPTGFITAKSGIENKILKHIVDNKIVYGCVSMPSNVFANTGTNVSVLFFDASKSADKVVLIDASKLGEEYKDSNGLKKVRLRDEEIEKIITTFQNKEAVDDFSVAVSYDEIKEKGYSLSAGQYFDIKIDYVDITEEVFNKRMDGYKTTLKAQFEESHRLEKEILKQLDSIGFNANVGKEQQ
jgi:putative type I restriction-modification system, M subunit